MLHAVGEEHYVITPTNGQLTVNTTFRYSDRGTIERNVTASLRMATDYTPGRAEIKGQGEPYIAEIDGSAATVQKGKSSRTFTTPMSYFTIIGSSPLAIQRWPIWRGLERVFRRNNPALLRSPARLWLI